jgi:hypothetical protein
MDGHAGLLQRAAQGTVAHAAADADRLPFRVQFDLLRQGVQQHVQAPVSPMRLKECRDPRALTRLERATTCASSATDSGRTTSADE